MSSCFRRHVGERLPHGVDADDGIPRSPPRRRGARACERASVRALSSAGCSRCTAVDILSPHSLAESRCSISLRRCRRASTSCRRRLERPVESQQREPSSTRDGFDPALRKRRRESLAALHLLEIRQGPRPIEVGLGRIVEPEIGEPVLTGHSRDPVLLESGRRLRPGIDVYRAVRVLAQVHP